MKLSRPLAEYISLEQRRREADLCEVVKYIRGLNVINPKPILQSIYSQSGRQRYKITESYSRTDIRNNIFTNRIVDLWNRLPEQYNVMIMFKKRLRYLAIV